MFLFSSNARITQLIISSKSYRFFYASSAGNGGIHITAAPSFSIRSFFIDLYLLQVSALNSLYFLLNELIAVRQVFHIIIDALIDEFGRPSFAFMLLKSCCRFLLQSTHRPGTVSAGGFLEAVDQFFKSWIFSSSEMGSSAVFQRTTGFPE